MKNLHDISLQHIEDWKAFNAYRQGKLKGFKTGIPRLDRNILGLTGIVGIQGSPGACKSTLALQIARYNASVGNPVLIIDRENGKHRFRTRLLCQAAGVSQDEVLKCEDSKLRSYYNLVKDLFMYVDTGADISPEIIQDYLSQMFEIYQKPMLLVVDSLQALPRNGVDERHALEAWLCSLDQLKLDWDDNLAIIMTSEKKIGSFGEASIDAGKGTGGIGYKCEILLDMRREDDIFLLDIVKNRDGETVANIPLRKVLAANGGFTYKLEEGEINLSEDL